MTILGTPRIFHKKWKFVIEIGGVRFAGFRTCGEIAINVAKIEHSEGGALIPDKSPGRVTVPDVELTRGATDDNDLYDWMQEVVGADSLLDEPLFKRTLDVVQLNRRGIPLKRWTLVNAWPIAFTGGDWDNEADENTIEKVTLAYDYPVLGGIT